MILMYSEVKSGYGQSTHKVLERKYSNILENKIMEKAIIKQKASEPSLCKDLGNLAHHPHGFFWFN